MHSLDKLNHLFIRHLRTMYSGEITLINALNAMIGATSDKSLRLFYENRMNEKLRIAGTLKNALHSMHEQEDGERDQIVESFVDESDNPCLTEGKALYIATMIFGRALSIYMSNSWETAISCAKELGMPNLTEDFSVCAGVDKYRKSDFEFLRGHAALRIVSLAAA
jgi:ferritin-like metal-binding protein YciE